MQDSDLGEKKQRTKEESRLRPTPVVVDLLELSVITSGLQHEGHRFPTTSLGSWLKPLCRGSDLLSERRKILVLGMAVDRVE